MARDYEGKKGIGQIFFCLIVAATLLIPYALSTMTKSLDNLLPIAQSVANTDQENYITAFFSTLSMADNLHQIIVNVIPYVIYVFYGIEGLTLLCTIIMLFLKNEPIRQILRMFSILTGFVMMAIFGICLLTVAGFFTYYFKGGFGEDAIIIDCITEHGLFFFLGLTAISALAMVKHFSSFFGKSH